MADLNLAALMQQAQALQAKFQEMQEQAAAKTVTAESGGGMVRVTVAGSMQVRRIEIDPSLIAPIVPWSRSTVTRPLAGRSSVISAWTRALQPIRPRSIRRPGAVEGGDATGAGEDAAGAGEDAAGVSEDGAGDAAMARPTPAIPRTRMAMPVTAMRQGTIRIVGLHRWGPIPHRLVAVAGPAVETERRAAR